MLNCSGIEIRYGNVPAVRGSTFRVDEGEIVCFVGPNGAGKSTTTLAVAGVLKPTKGTILFQSRSIAGLDGRSLYRWHRARARRPSHLQPAHSPRELVRGQGLAWRIEECRIDPRTGIDPFPHSAVALRQFAGHLSGGEQQQLAIARALLTQPKLLIVDEPSLVRA